MSSLSFLRVLIPRRFDNVLNFVLTVVLFFMFLFFRQRADQDQIRMLPTQKGYHWETTTPPPHTRPSKDVKRTGPGEGGAAVELSGKARLRGESDMRKWFMNVVASDRISLDRSIPDTRPKECKSVNYDANLPNASVVIIFTDEAWTPLMRTVHSVVNRSPPRYLQEVVLIDDFSKRDELKRKLDDYIIRFRGLVRVVRLKQRQGLIRAKLFGAKEAKAEVVVFLDSHCEANEGWLEPILQRIKENRKAVVCPIIDHISARTMEYSGHPGVESVGGFWWSLHFRWDPVPDEERQRRKSPTEPMRSPTMAGGLLAANRIYFLEVGGYDPGMDIWGGENLEISFRFYHDFLKVWMCGGSIEFLPCSHVGHIFRAGHPYNMTGPGGNKDVHGTNSKRLAEVWMDDYKRLFYLHRKDLVYKDVGNFTDRKELRKKLQCQSFKWYLDNIAKDKFVPDEDVAHYGSVKNPATNLCIDTMQRDEKTIIDLGVFMCQGGGSAQFFSYTAGGQLRRELSCATIQPSEINGFRTVVSMMPCNTREDYADWEYNENTQQLRHKPSGLCADASGLHSGDGLAALPCSETEVSKTQVWHFAN